MKPILPTMLLVLVMASGCLSSVEPVDIAVASYPAAFVVERLVGDDLQVADLGTGVGLHDFEPSTRDIDQLRQSTDLILWDETLESWAHRAEESLGRSAPRVYEMSALPGDEPYITGADDEEDDHGHEEGHGHDHGAYDPHTWTDPLAMQASARGLSNYLRSAYPDHAASIQERTDALVADLADLHTAFEEALQDCTRDTVITNHEAHNYLAHRYDFHLLALHGLEPGSQPSPNTIEHIIERIRELKTPVIFIEEGTDRGALRAIQDETGVDVQVLHTLETRPDEGDYLDAQYENVERLRHALGCP